MTVSADTPITTDGGDATGVVVQSIGGGGLGGSAGSDTSTDNPIIAAAEIHPRGFADRSVQVGPAL